MGKLDLNTVIKDKEKLKKILRASAKTDNKLFDIIQRKMWKDGSLLKGEFLTRGIDF